MGGNVVIQGVSATPIGLTNPGSRVRILCFLSEIIRFLNRKSGFQLWDRNLTDTAEIGPYMAGSSSFLTDRSITDNELTFYKPAMGDIDIFLDETKKDVLVGILDQLVDQTPWAIKGTLLGYKMSPGTIITLWTYGYQNIQIDFDLVPFADQLPTEWARFSRHSDWNDAIGKVKGVAHKYVFRALTGKNLIEGAAVQLKTKVVTRNITEWVFSLNGARQKYQQIGPDLWQEISPSALKYVQSVNFLGEKFLTRYTAEDQEKLWSFEGVLSLVAREPEQDQQKVARAMSHLLYAKGAQTFYRDAALDFDAKAQITKKMCKMLSLTDDTLEHIAKMAHGFYWGDDGIIKDI